MTALTSRDAGRSATRRITGHLRQALAAWVRRAISARERTAAERTVAYLHSLDDQSLAALGIRRSEIASRFGPHGHAPHGRA